MEVDGGAPALPRFLRRYFWDHDPNRLSWERSRSTIVGRLLQSGGLDAIAWLRVMMSDDEIREFIVHRGGRGIEPRRLRFWSVIVDIPPAQVDEWIRAKRKDPWEQRTHG